MGKRIMAVSRDFLCSLLTHGLHSYDVVGGALPKDTVVTGMSDHVYFVQDRIAVRLESSEWEGPADGERIPELPDITFRAIEIESWRDREPLL